MHVDTAQLELASDNMSTFYVYCIMYIALHDIYGSQLYVSWLNPA